MDVQLQLPLDDLETVSIETPRGSIDPEARSIDPEAVSIETPIAPGQWKLFEIAPIESDEDVPPNLAGAIGDIAEERFRGICIAYGYVPLTPPSGHKDWDCVVNGWYVQVKGTATITGQGRVGFQAGSGKRGSKRRFSDYAGKADFFAFVYVGPIASYNGCMLLLETSEVLRRCPGPKITFRTMDLRKTFDSAMAMLAAPEEQSVAATHEEGLTPTCVAANL